MKKIVKKYFIPHEGNEFKPHIFRRSSVALLSLVTVFIFFVGVINVEILKNTNLLSAVISRTVVALTNTNRVQGALPDLVVNPVLERVAQEKANDMAAKGYFAHTSPDGLAPWHWFKSAGYNFMYAGENLAVNFTDSEAVDTAWMNSPGHRANILNGKFTEIGVATAQGMYKGRETTFVVQMFGKPAPAVDIPVKKVPVMAPKIATATASTTLAVSTTSPKTSTSSTTASPPLVRPTQTTSVLGETFIEGERASDLVANPALVSDETLVNTAPKPSFIEKTLTTPKKTVSILYALLAGIIILSLAMMIGVEVKKQHPKNVLAGAILLFSIILLLFIYRSVLFGEVIVL